MQIPRAALKQQDFLPAQRNITITVKSAKLSHKISPSARSDPPARLSVRRRHREIISQRQTSIDTRTTAPGGGRFLNGAVAGETYADFDQSLAPINGNSHGSAGGSFTAQGGESLGQLAQQLWGDSSLWYRLAQANGLTGETRLGAGQTIAIPSGIMRSSHSAATFNPYDPLAAMGDTSPTTPAPPVMSSGGGRRSGCGVIGQLLVMAISIAVSVALPGAPFLYIYETIENLRAVRDGLCHLDLLGSISEARSGCGPSQQLLVQRDKDRRGCWSPKPRAAIAANDLYRTTDFAQFVATAHGASDRGGPIAGRYCPDSGGAASIHLRES